MLRLRHIWRAMKRRCHVATSKTYERYGALGVTVCDEWRDSFDSFAQWALSSGYQSDLTIDRRDGCKTYSPSTCRWATYGEQAQNRKKKAGSKCPFIGVNPENGRWVVSIQKSGTRVRIGRFSTAEEAARAYDAAALAAYGPGARVNFPQEVTA